MTVVFSLDLQSTLHLQETLAYRVLTQPVQWGINFVTVLALLYLFHYQGRKRLDLERPKVYKELLGPSVPEGTDVPKISSIQESDATTTSMIGHVSSAAEQSNFQRFIQDTVGSGLNASTVGSGLKASTLGSVLKASTLGKNSSFIA